MTSRLQERVDELGRFLERAIARDPGGKARFTLIVWDGDTLRFGGNADDVELKTVLGEILPELEGGP